MLPSLPTLTFSVYTFTLLLAVLEKTVIKKRNRNFNVNQLNMAKMKSVDAFDEKIIRKSLPALNAN